MTLSSEVQTLAGYIQDLIDRYDREDFGNRNFASVDDILGSDQDAAGEGALWQAAGYVYIEAAEGAVDAHITTAGGVPLYATGQALVTPEAWGADPTGAASATAILTAMMDAGVGEIYCPAGHDYLAKNFVGVLAATGPGRVSGVDATPKPVALGQPIKTPDAFGWRPPVTFWLDGPGQVGWSCDFEGLFNAAGVDQSAHHYYVDHAAADGGIGALTGGQGDPFPRLSHVAIHIDSSGLASGTPVVVHVQPGIYGNLRAFKYTTWTAAQLAAFGDRHVTIIADDWQGRGETGPVYCGALIAANDPLTPSWTLGATGTYSAALAGVPDFVLDRRTRGVNPHNWARLTLAASQAECEGTPGSYYSDGTVLHLHLHDDRAPDADVVILRNQVGYGLHWPGGPYTLYLRDLAMLGRDGFYTAGVADGGAGAHSGIVATEDCYSGFRPDGSGFLTNDQYLTAHLRHRGGVVEDDCISYHANNPPAAGAYAMEIDCSGYEANVGQGAPRNGNASTAHDAMTVFRINTRGWACNGPAIADANGCNSYMIGCVSAHPQTEGTDISHFIVGSDEADPQTAAAWLVECGAPASATNSAFNPGNTGTIHVANYRGAPIGKRADGTVTSYEIEYWEAAPEFDLP